MPPEYLVGDARRRDALRAHHRAATACSTRSPRWRSTTRRVRSYFRKRARASSCCWRARNKLDPLSVRGSYAGAMGALQFMPSQLPPLRGQRREHATAARPVGRLGRHLCEHRQLPARARLAVRGAGAGRGAARPEPTLPDRAARASDAQRDARRLRARGMTVATRRCRDDTPALLLGRTAAGRARLSRRLPELLRDHALQRQRPLYAMAVYDLAQAIAQQIAQEARALSAALRARAAARGCRARRRGAAAGRLRRTRRRRSPAPRRAGAAAHRAAAQRRRRPIPDAVPRAEPRSAARQPAVLRRGRPALLRAAPAPTATVERGVASWYGPNFHGVQHLHRRTLRHVRA